MGHPSRWGEKLTKAMPAVVMGKGVSLADPTTRRPRGMPRASSSAAWSPRTDTGEVVELAKGIEGLKRQWGVHAAGVIMSSEPSSMSS